ncbi:MAG TPA: type II toxin-antitoxin system RelE/ParE family toxin [Gammaproteobacteria bacterium]|nr:type II toxin-antitoxin system RelE/ParE family toxin [Gammaproteobacteria bacterium]
MTTPYHIKIAPTAKKQFTSLPKKTQRILLKLIEALAMNPRPPGVKKIDGMTGLYSQDVNHVRLIYKIEEQEVLLLLIK